MTKDDFILIDHLTKLKEMGMAEKDALQRMIRTYLDPGFSMCFTCDPQIRQAWKRLGDWWLMKRDDFYKSIFMVKEITKKKKEE